MNPWNDIQIEAAQELQAAAGKFFDAHGEVLNDKAPGTAEMRGAIVESISILLTPVDTMPVSVRDSMDEQAVRAALPFVVYSLVSGAPFKDEVSRFRSAFGWCIGMSVGFIIEAPL